jgi:DNA-binding NtrC family response regulator
MFTPHQYRAKAAEYAELAKTADRPGNVRELQDLERSFTTLADNEQWLADNYDHTVHAAEHGQPGRAGPVEKGADGERPDLAEEEEHILRCLGAALILQWSTIPAKLQRELFDNAGAMGEVLDTPILRRRIARFLHQHKDD